MVEHPVRMREFGVSAQSAFAHLWHGGATHSSPKASRVTTRRSMLHHNRVRAEHEYRWYFGSRFPGARLKTLTATMSRRVLAFDSGPLPKGRTAPLSYP
jgi:hypothetical protein